MFISSKKIKPKKSLGQNFLVDKGILNKIVDAAELKVSDLVYEIGPGKGVLTRELCSRAKQVIALELDERMIQETKKVCSSFQNLEVRNEDALQFSPPGSEWKLVANIPYYLTGKLFRRILFFDNKPTKIVLLLPRDVVLRILESDDKSSLLSLSVAVFGEPREVVRVSPEAFEPKPKIESSVIAIDVFSKSKIPYDKIEPFFSFLNKVFQRKRKTLRNIFKQLEFSDEQISVLESETDLNLRPERLKLLEWFSIYKNLFS